MRFSIYSGSQGKARKEGKKEEGRSSVIAAPGTTCSSFPCYYSHVPIQTVQEGIFLTSIFSFSFLANACV